MLIFEPNWPWSYVALAAAGLAVAFILLRGAVDFFQGKTCWKILGGTRPTRIAVLLLSLLAAALFAAAAMNPYLIKKSSTTGLHLQVVVDVSDSVLRASGGWTQVKKECLQKITASVTATDRELRQKSTAGILTFRDNVDIAVEKKSFKNLPEYFSQLDKQRFASGEGTNIEMGLSRGREQLDKAGGAGAVLLISDGNQTAGNALAAAQQLAQQGIPIHVYPVISRTPALAITDADLPRQTHADVQTYVRGILLNSRSQPVSATLTFHQNPGLNPEPGDPLLSMDSQREFPIKAGQWVSFRQPLMFQGYGIQFVDLTLTFEGEQETHRRRFFSHVERPPRLLAIGGNNQWAEAIPGDVAEVTQVSYSELPSASQLKHFDAVVINSVPGSRLNRPFMEAVAKAVEKKGIGLMLINGDHYGADDEAETVIMSYKKTPLHPILPVVGGPRPFLKDPPSRQVAILIDTSGSMSGAPLEKAKEIARYIVSKLLRPKDRLDLISFTTGAGHLIKDRYMDSVGKKAALEKIDRIAAGGGTDPNEALNLIGSRKMKDCGMIFISDGIFGHVTYRPDCRATVFAIGWETVQQNSPLWQLSDPFPVGSNFDPRSIVIPYFDPQPRLKFFESGSYQPLSMEKHLRQSHRLPVPQLPLYGNAVCYVKDDAVLNGVRPKLTDPVLASGESGMGCVLVFTTEIPFQWARAREGRKAIETWIRRLIPYIERDRYDFKLKDRGDVIDLRVSLVPRKGEIPRVDQLTGDIDFPDGSPVGIALRADPVIPGVFHGEIKMDRDTQTLEGFLSLYESGPGALARPQRIPILIPPREQHTQKAAHSEDYTYGQNRELLKQITDIGGGVFDPPAGTPFFKAKPAASRGAPLWPWLAAAAVLCYLAATALMRWNP